MSVESVPRFLLDGREIAFEPGQTIMAAAAQAGVYIPHLCHHPDFQPHGSCRLCCVRVDGRVEAACATPAQAGTAVENLSEDLQRDRRRLTQMLFIEGNHHCPFCERSGNCQLQAVAYFVGMEDSHYAHFYPRRELDASHPDFLLDRDRCIQCALCVRASREADGKNVFELAGRGAATRLIVNSPSGLLKDSALQLTDRAAHICPVGAILIKREGYRAPIGERLYDEQTIAEAGNRRPEDE
ncbi:2Fe-2S iron-sulfur cluster-binding protein [Chromobacterium alticapitis]|uniref:NADP oxidoreductase n=1 Tax=Chromobacterium alticapitis TaxID=2073169 RepID=A0A2S5DAS1_9NEIS|nr:2Fe-2S iron-sulfur cluster-binding protein [Chromobacterium alticapitis]POZ60138.1 NADP oxidoreductase [Chromobacterium alticapitis]